jgi:AcrR family transcriptional regulator
MADVNTSSVAKRRYRSPLREAQAAATRARILDTALDTFLERGYAGTSVVAVARAAGVSPETVYATFGSKRGIVAGLLERVDAEDRPRRAADRSRERGGGPEVDLEILAEAVADFWMSNGRLVRLLRQGIGDPEIGRLWERRQRARRRLIGNLVGRWPAGSLRRGLTADTATDLAWALTTVELHEMLVGECGWTPDAYVAWLRGALRRELLVSSPAERGA